MTYYTYILASQKNGTLYVGVTNNLAARAYTHKADTINNFVTKYQIHRLVHFEQFEDIEQAIRREKQLKRWNRQWKIDLINQHNPDWRDLYQEILA